jgi:hypothetical protein
MQVCPVEPARPPAAIAGDPVAEAGPDIRLRFDSYEP